jgi:uncharacterized cupin superfamily protein
VPGEAPLDRVGSGLAPVGDGWFVVDVRRAAWLRHEVFGLRCPFETSAPVARAVEGLEARPFTQLGVHLAVLEPGRPSTLYHAELDNQEDFLVLSGECICVIEDEERRLRAWDFVHCPPGTRHAFVGAGADRCVLVMIGRRRSRTVRYFRSSRAVRHGAAAERETDSPTEAYAPFGHWRNAGPPNPAGL